MGRWLVVLAALSACGRFGFGSASDGSVAGDDAVIDTPTGDAPTGDAAITACGKYTEITVGHRGTCFVDTDGVRWCVGQFVGFGDVITLPNELATDGSSPWSHVHLGYEVGQGLIGGTVIEWTSGVTTPYLLDSDGDWDQIVGEFDYLCRIKSTGAMTCGTSMVIPGAWKMSSVSQVGDCGVQMDGTAWCWGENLNNDLGLGVEANGTNHPAPVQVGVDTDWAEVHVADGHTCGRKTNGTLWCWGDPASTGTNNVDSLGVPTQVGTATDWTQVESHWHHSCGVHATGKVDCWGFDEYNLEVVPGSNHADVPTDLGILAEEFHTGGHHYCAKMAGVWYCWGRNDEGQLGVGTNVTTTAPTTTICR